MVVWITADDDVSLRVSRPYYVEREMSGTETGIGCSPSSRRSQTRTIKCANTIEVTYRVIAYGVLRV